MHCVGHTFFAIKIARYFKLVIHMKILNAKSKFAKLYKLFVFKFLHLRFRARKR